MDSMEIEYVPVADFVNIARSRDDKRALVNIDGHNRWVFTREDGSQYILRPQS